MADCTAMPGAALVASEREAHIDKQLADTADTALLALCAKYDVAFAHANGLPFSDEPGGEGTAAAWEAVRALELSIAETPALSVAGVRAKAALIEASARDYGDQQPNFDRVGAATLRSLLGDVAALALPPRPDRTEWEAALAAEAEAARRSEAEWEAIGELYEEITRRSDCPTILKNRNGDQAWHTEQSIIDDKKLSFDEKAEMVPALRALQARKEAAEVELDNARRRDEASASARLYWQSRAAVYDTPAPDFSALFWKLRQVLAEAVFDTEAEDLDDPDFIAGQLAIDGVEHRGARLYQDAVRLLDPSAPILHIAPFDAKAWYDAFTTQPGFQFRRGVGPCFVEAPGLAADASQVGFQSWSNLKDWQKKAVHAHAKTLPDPECVAHLVDRCRQYGDPSDWEAMVDQGGYASTTDQDRAEALRQLREGPQPRNERKVRLEDLIAEAKAAWAALDAVTIFTDKVRLGRAATGEEGAEYERANDRHNAAVQAVRDYEVTIPCELALKVLFLSGVAGNVEGEAEDNLDALAHDALQFAPRAEIGLTGGAA